MNDYIKKIEQDDKQYIWHPFTQMQDYVSSDNLIIEHAEGNYLFDIYGNKYLDGVSSLWTNVHGHRKKGVDDAISEQLSKVAHSTLLGISNVPAIECARKLVEITPDGLDRVFFSDNGAASVEIALKIAYQYQQQSGGGNSKRTRFISFKNAYHGDTIGSVSVGGIDLFHEVYRPLLFQTIQAESPYCYRCPLGREYPACDMLCLEGVETLMRKNHDEICALVIEPLVQGAAGILVQPPGYLKAIRELCDKYDILMIADEVAVGFGKTGSLFACEKEGIVPDILCLAKGISAGYLPLAATLVSNKIYEAFLGKFEEFKTFFHGHTYTGNPLACAAAIANISIFESENVIDSLQEKIDHLQLLLKRFRELPAVGDIRQCGIMVGIELVADRETRRTFKPEERIGQHVIAEARKQGVLIRPLGDVIVLMPPLSITLEELDMLCSVVYESISKVTGDTAQ